MTLLLLLLLWCRAGHAAAGGDKALVEGAEPSARQYRQPSRVLSARSARPWASRAGRRALAAAPNRSLAADAGGCSVAACLEDGAPDGDCCAALSHGSCASGFEFAAGPPCSPSLCPSCVATCCLAATPLAAVGRRASIPPGGLVRVFAVGSSNALWQTWVDQLHSYLLQLGYRSPAIDVGGRRRFMHPRRSATCDNHDVFASLDTPRIAKPGWSSWGFSYENQVDCDAGGYRRIFGVEVCCTNGWMCNPEFAGPEPFVAPSDLAQDAGQVEVAVLANWVNDFRHRFAGNVCFDGEVYDMDVYSNVTVDSLLRTIRAIHAANANTVVAVLSLYPGSIRTRVGDDPTRINSLVSAGLAGEPNTVWVNYTIPRDEEMYLARRSGHLNCRGDKVLATSIIDALFRAGVLSRGLALGDQSCLARSDCAGLTPACCQRSALCWTNAAGACVAYTPGQEEQE